MTQYAKYLSETEVQYPTAAEFPGVINWQSHDFKLREKGYCPISNMPPEQSGKTLHLDTFAHHPKTNGRIEPRPVEVDDYEERPNPETGEMERVKVGSHIEWHDTTISVDESWITVETYHYEDIPEPAHTVEEYDSALEDYLREVQCERGYTSRDPALYANSTNPRWAQDAIDWIDFRDRVMAYGLEIENQYASTGVAPCTLDEFKAHLRTIECHWTYTISDTTTANQ